MKCEAQTLLFIINYHLKTVMLVRLLGVGSLGLRLLGDITLGVTIKTIAFFVRNLVQCLVFRNHTTHTNNITLSDIVSSILFLIHTLYYQRTICDLELEISYPMHHSILFHYELCPPSLLVNNRTEDKRYRLP